MTVITTFNEHMENIVEEHRQQHVTQCEQGLVVWEILMDQDDSELIPTSKRQYEIQQQMTDPIDFATSMNLDILYMHQAMRTPDCNKFIEAVATEIQGHEQMRNFIPLPLSCVPKGTKLINMVWSMCCKHQI